MAAPITRLLALAALLLSVLAPPTHAAPCGIFNPLSSGGFLTIANAGDSIDLRSSDYTVCARVRRAAEGGDDVVLAQGTAAANDAVYFGYLADDTFNFAMWGDGLSVAAAGDSGTWHHYCGVFTTADKRQVLYKDGNTTPVGSRTAANQYTGSGPIWIGTMDLGATDYELSGDVDDIRVYTRALGAAEVAEVASGTYNDNTNLKLDLRFEESSGQIAFDSSGNSNYAAFVSAPSAELCDGSFGELDVATVGPAKTTSAVSLANQDFTLCARIKKLVNTGVYDLVTHGEQQNNNGLFLGFWHQSTAYLGFWFNNVEYSDASLLTKAGIWTHFCGVVDATTKQRWLYIDGALVVTDTYTTAYGGPDSVLNIGTQVERLDFDSKTADGSAKFDDVRLYKRVMGATEVAEVFARTYSDNTNLELALNFDSFSNGLTTDDSPAGNDAVLYDAPLYCASNPCDPTGASACVDATSSCTCNTAYYGPTCACNIPSLNVTTDNAAVLITDSLPAPFTELSSNTLKIVFRKSLKYSLVSYNFESNDCGQNAVGGDWTWATSEVEGTDCYAEHRGSVAWTNALISACGITKDTTDPTKIVFTVPFSVTTRETLESIRGVQYTRDVEHQLPFKIEFPAQVDATAANVQVFSPLRPLLAIVQQDVVEGDVAGKPQLDLKVFSSIQYPFVLLNPPTATLPAGMTLSTGGAAAVEGSVCADPLANNGDPPCENFWTLSVEPTAYCGDGEPTNFNGAFSLEWDVACHDSIDGTEDNCPLDSAGETVTMSFNVVSNEYCPKLVDKLTFITTFNVYDSLDAGKQVKTNFLDGQTMYFEATLRAPGTTVQSTSWKQVTVLHGASCPNDCLYMLSGDASDTVMQDGLDYNFDRATGGGAPADGTSDSKPTFWFDALTGPSFLNIAADSYEQITVGGIINVVYASGELSVTRELEVQSTASSSWRGRFDSLGSIVKDQDVAEMSKSVGLGSPPGSESSSESTIMGFSATVVYGAAGLIALLAIVALVMIRRGRRRRHGSNHTAGKEQDTEMMARSSSTEHLVRGEDGENENDNDAQV